MMQMIFLVKRPYHLSSNLANQRYYKFFTLNMVPWTHSYRSTFLPKFKPSFGSRAHSSPSYSIFKNCGPFLTCLVARLKSFKPLSTSLRVSTHPVSLKECISLLIKRNGPIRKYSFNTKGIFGGLWTELYPDIVNSSYQHIISRCSFWRLCMVSIFYPFKTK